MATFLVAVKNPAAGLDRFEGGYSAETLEAAKELVIQEHELTFGEGTGADLVWTERKTGIFAKLADKNATVAYRIRQYGA